MNLLERYCMSTGNVVVRDSSGKPGIFVRHPKMKSIDFDSSLPDHTHPAFVVGEDEDPAILIGKYLNSIITENGSLYSLPNAIPDLATGNDSQILSRIRSVSGKISGLTIADFGFIVLLSQKYPDKFAQLSGNTAFGFGPVKYGQNANTSKIYKFGESVQVNAIKVYAGIEYKCLIAHTTSKALLPTDHPDYWEKLTRVGGVWSGAKYNVDDATYGDLPATTLTGSGPLNWYMFSDISMEADLCSNTTCALFGIMLNGAEINILPNNNAADPEVDLSDSSAEWKAILPHSNNNGYDLVAPGTSGTLKIANVNNKATYVARDLQSGEYKSGLFGTKFNAVEIEVASLPYVPYILYELGLLPLPGKTISGTYNFGTVQGAKRTLMFGNHFGNIGVAPSFTLWAKGATSSYSGSVGTRSRARETA